MRVIVIMIGLFVGSRRVGGDRPTFSRRKVSKTLYAHYLAACQPYGFTKIPSEIMERQIVKVGRKKSARIFIPKP
jgi:hypothetical protein